MVNYGFSGYTVTGTIAAAADYTSTQTGVTVYTEATIAKQST